MEIYRGPKDKAYSGVTQAGHAETLSPEALPEVVIPMTALFGL